MSQILIADDHPLYRDALRISLASRMPDVQIQESSDMQTTLEVLKANSHQSIPDLDLLLLDLHMPGSEDLFGLLHIRKLYPDIPVGVVSGLEQVEIVSKVMDAGAMGFIPKVTPAEQLVEAIEKMLEGDTWLPERIEGQLDQVEDCALGESFSALADKVSLLTPAQYKVLCLLRDGLLNKQIGYQLGIAEKTVKTHITSVLRKLEITNRTQAVLIANQLKLEPPA